MFVTLRRMSLPLLIKELQEQAARRRTYLIRIAYVVFLACSALLAIEQQLRSLTPLNALGQGAAVLTALVNWQFWAIFMLLPGMACGVLTTEKERNTLALLFLTRLGPWAIIMEKLLSRLFPMVMFLMCGLPVMAFTYSMGGLTLFTLFIAAYYLFLALWLTGCVAVMCSARNNSTVGAFIQTYFVLMAFTIAPHFLYYFVPQALLLEILDVMIGWADFSSTPRPRGQPLYYQYGIHPYVFTHLLSPANLFSSFNNSMSALRTPWIPALFLGFPGLASGLACLCVARWSLYRRAFVAPSNPLLKLLRGIDKIFFWANRKFTFDVKLVQEADSLPDTEPIAWREVSKRSLGQFRYLVRVMIPLMFPVIFIGTLMVTAPDLHFVRRNGLTPLVFFLWAVSLVLVMITAANTIPLERTRQTWDVLRSIPLTGQEILSQKLRGVRRLQWVSSIPLISAIALQTWWLYQVYQFSATTTTAINFLWWEYLIGAVTSVAIYSELVKWISMWCGLMVRNSMRALLLSVHAVGVFITLPHLVLRILVNLLLDPIMRDEFSFGMSIATSTSPWVFIWTNEAGDLRRIFSLPLAPALIHAVTQGGLLWLIHRHIMHRADWYLGRIGIPNSTRIEHTTGLESMAAEIPHANSQRTDERNSEPVTPAGRN